MILQEHYTLANGVTVPKVGLGTWFIHADTVAQAVTEAIGLGYRNIDTAQAYDNESGVGAAIRNSSVPREELFVSSKIAAEIKDSASAEESIEQTLAIMQLDYLDLMLIHSPQPWADFRGGEYAAGNRAVWAALEQAYAAGKFRAIGVSNFLEHDLQNILDSGTVVPHVNQVKLHPSKTPMELLQHCTDLNILVQAYSPIAHGAILQDPTLGAMAQRYNVSVPQLCVRYALQLGTQPLPKSDKPEHMRSNADLDFHIADEDMAALLNMAPPEDQG